MSRASVLLVHAAFTDSSSWSRVIPLLMRQGVPVIAPPIPLTSLTDDVITVRRTLRHINGPVILAAHSYGGAVITAAATPNDNVAGLVFVAAMAPDAGETVAELLHRSPNGNAVQLQPDSEGYISAPVAAFERAIAPDATDEEIRIMAATQKPISVSNITEHMGRPAWRDKRTWYLLTERDCVIPPETQRFFAERMGAAVTTVAADHTPLLSAPAAVARVILDAVNQVSAVE